MQILKINPQKKDMNSLVAADFELIGYHPDSWAEANNENNYTKLPKAKWFTLVEIIVFFFFLFPFNLHMKFSSFISSQFLFSRGRMIFY